MRRKALIGPFYRTLICKNIKQVDGKCGPRSTGALWMVRKWGFKLVNMPFYQLIHSVSTKIQILSQC